MSFRIGSVNLLSPHTDLLKNHTPPQADRIPFIASKISATGMDGLVVCEAESEENLADLALLTGMDIQVLKAQEDAEELIAILTKPAHQPSDTEVF